MSGRITVVAPILARYDAISSAAADNFRLLREEPAWIVSLLTSHNELGVSAGIARDVVELLEHEAFRYADILIYHFGIWHPFIDALMVGNGHARQVVVFHNITPAEFVSPADRPIIEKSFRQAHNLSKADEIWADSPVNAAALSNYDVDPERVLVVPLAVSRPDFGRLRDKRNDRLEFLFVGRVVAAKGVRDLIEAVIGARPAIAAPIRVTIAGNASFSDGSYIEACKTRIAEALAPDEFELVDTPDDATLCKLYARAHVLCVPSFHEGFCVPVIEGFRAGCIPVGYASGNVPNVANRLGRLVATGDVPGLTGALAGVASGLAADRIVLDRGTVTIDEFDRLARAHAATFDFARLSAVKIAHVGRLLRNLPPNPHEVRESRPYFQPPPC